MILFRSGGSDTISVSRSILAAVGSYHHIWLNERCCIVTYLVEFGGKRCFRPPVRPTWWAGLGEGVFHRCGVAVPTGRQSGQSEETHSPGASVVVCRISPVNPVNRGGLGGSNVDSRTDLKRKLVSPARGKGRRGRGQRILGLASSIWALASAPAIAPMVCTASATPSPMPALVEIRWENESLIR